MTDIPDEVYDLIERVAAMQTPTVLAVDLLAKYPRLQPEPAWKDGDVVLTDDADTWKRVAKDFWSNAEHRRGTGSDAYIAKLSPDLIVRGGRRVHPARFADLAALLRVIANSIESPLMAGDLRRIADDLAGDTDD